MATCFRLTISSVKQSLIWANGLIINYTEFDFSKDPDIRRLYKGRSCADTSVKTGGLCIGDEPCDSVIPSTPGNLTSVCPAQANFKSTSSIQRKATRKDRTASTPRIIAEENGRLVGTSTLHTFTKRGPLRYPWMCSLKTRGFRWVGVNHLGSD